MKKILMLIPAMILAAGVYAVDFNIEARTDLVYTSFIKNAAYWAMADTALAEGKTLTAVEAFEKLRLKAKAAADQVKFDFDARLYLWPWKNNIDYTIDSAYVSIEKGPFVIYAGKQRVKWGTGYFWNPSDNLQKPKNVFRSAEDLEGILAVRGEYSNDFITPSVMIIADAAAGSARFFDNADAAAQLYKLVGACDVYVNCVSKKDVESAGIALSLDAGLFVINAEAVRKAPKGRMFDFNSDEYGPDGVIGVSKTIGDFLIAAEYYRKNSGMSNGDFGAVVSAGFPGMSKKDYAAYTINYVWNESISISLTGMHGLDDGTSYLFPAIGFVENQSFDVQLSLLQNLTQPGMNEGNYSTPVYGAAELRINAYF